MKGVIYFTIISFILSMLIVLLNNILHKRDTKIDKITKLLPGYNCGACGYGSCVGMAKELINDKNVLDKCKVCKNKEEILNHII